MEPSETAHGSTERQLFVRALERPTGEARAAFLAEACAGNPDLRRRLEALLHRFESLGSYLEEPAVSSPAEPQNPARPEHLEETVQVRVVNEKAGDRLGR